MLGVLIRKVTLKGNVVDQYKIKQIAPNNYSVLDTTSYYCTEVYRDTAGKIRVRAIPRASLVCKGKKLWLTCPNPADYAEHIMYLFKNDYIVVKKKNKILFEGFYLSSYAIKASRLCGFYPNTPPSHENRTPFTLSHDATIQKYDINILGKKGGEISCGEPLSLLPEKK